MSTFGLIKSTGKIEQEHERLLAAYKEYCEVEKSEELKQYTELEAFVQSEAFAAKKKEIENLRFKGSPEETLQKEFVQLSKNKPLKKFYATLQSAELQRYFKIGNSETMAEYLSLKKYMEDGSFATEKKKSDADVYKGSAEEKQLNEFKSLGKSKTIKTYFQLNGSAELKQKLAIGESADYKKYSELKTKVEKGSATKEEKQQFRQLKKSATIGSYNKFIASSAYKLFRETEGSPTLKRFEELKKITSSKEFTERKTYLEDRKKFEKTEAFAKSERYKKLKTSDDILFFVKFEKSSAWKNYLAMENSKERRRFEELKKHTGSDEFMKRKAYLEDAKKWEKTDEYKKHQQYEELKKKPQIERYFKYKSNNELDFFKNWELVFSDDFGSAKLDTGKWQTVSYHAAQTLERNYSQPGDLQAFTSGANINTNGKTLKIETRREKTDGLVWQLPFGFVEKEFDYSSGCINSGNSFWGKEGIWEAKVKYAPVKGLVSALFLAGENNSQQINILETGIQNRVGLLNQDNKQTESISGLKSGRFYIFRLEWNKDTMVWKVNNKELLSVNTKVQNTELHINAATIVVDEIQGALPASFEIDWIKVYQQKK